MRPVPVNAKLAVYEKYKENLNSHKASAAARQKLEENDKNILEKIDSDAYLLRSMTQRLLYRLNQAVAKDLKDIESPRFLLSNDAADTTRVYNTKTKISEYIQKAVETATPNVLTKKELQHLLEDTVRESFTQSGKNRAGRETEFRVRHELKKNGWNILKRNQKIRRIDVDIIANDKGTGSEEEVAIYTSCKRTIRERWRQNITGEFDVFLHASLGSDLSLATLKNYPNNIHIVPDDANLSEKEKKSNQVQRISWVTPANIRKFISQLSI